MAIARPASPTHRPLLDALLLGILRLGAFLCLAGWTWVHFYWEAPYGILLWQDATYELATELGVSWEEFVGTGADDGWLQLWLARVWWLYLLCTIACLTAGSSRAKPNPHRSGTVRSMAGTMLRGSQLALLVLGSVLLTILSYAKYVASQQQLPMFIEHGGQMLMPCLLAMGVWLGVRHPLTVATAMLAFVMTFAGHGCYAVGWWPTPANFYGMISLVLGVEYDTAQTILRTCGALDFVVCVGIFIPYLRIPCAAYAAAWGFLTAIARPVAGMSWSLNYWGADQFLHEAILRAPHSLIPLYLGCLWIGQYAARASEQSSDSKRCWGWGEARTTSRALATQKNQLLGDSRAARPALPQLLHQHCQSPA